MKPYRTNNQKKRRQKAKEGGGGGGGGGKRRRRRRKESGEPETAENSRMNKTYRHWCGGLSIGNCARGSDLFNATLTNEGQSMNFKQGKIDKEPVCNDNSKLVNVTSRCNQLAGGRDPVPWLPLQQRRLFLVCSSLANVRLRSLQQATAPNSRFLQSK